MNKKAVSGIVATVILILLSTALVGVLSLSIINLVQQPVFAPEYSCPILQSKNILTIQDACYNEVTKDIEIVLRRSGDESITINSLEFITNNNTETNTWTCGNSCGTCKLLKVGNTRKYFFEADGTEKSLSIRANNCILEKQDMVKCK